MKTFDPEENLGKTVSNNSQLPFEPLLADNRVTDICINGTDSIYYDAGQGLCPLRYAPQSFSQENLRSWVLEQLSQVGKTWDAKHPFVDATLPSGHRVHVTFPPMARQGILVSLRRLPGTSAFFWNSPHLSSVLGAEVSTSPQGAARWQNAYFYETLAAAVKKGDSVLISGATGSGKTTLATDLLAEVPENERIIALEDTQELAPRHPHFLSLVSRPPNSDGYGEVTLRALLKQTLRMRPDRIILGECRGSEVLELLQALNTGHGGALATLHANSSREALKRIELLCLLTSQGSIPLSCIRELLSLGIQWLVHVGRTQHVRRIQELWKIEGREGDTILMRPVLECENEAKPLSNNLSSDVSFWKR